MASPYMTLIKAETNDKFEDGCYRCQLRMYDSFEHLVGIWLVCTGQGWAQDFRIAGNNIPGSMEPLPQGDYTVFDMQWAEFNSWSQSLGAGIGPVFVPIVCSAEKRRGEFGIHMDYNRAISPGTAGCIGMLDKRDMQKLVDLLRVYDPKLLKVDWGL